MRPACGCRDCDPSGSGYREDWGGHSSIRSRVGCSRITPTPEGIPAGASAWRVASQWGDEHGIRAPDERLAQHHRFRVLNDLWGRLAQADVSLDLLLYSRSECEERQHWRSHVIGRAYREGRLLHGAL